MTILHRAVRHLQQSTGVLAVRLLILALSVLVYACGVSAGQSPTAQHPATLAEARPLTAAATAHTTPVATANGASPCAALLDGSATTGDRRTLAADSPDTALKMHYDADTNTIEVQQGASITLPALSRALGRPEALRELAPGEWLLGANLEIAEDASVRIAAPDVRWLKLRSDVDGFVWIKALGAELAFAGVCVTSWDGGRVDEIYDDGRSFVLARDGAHLTIRDSELSYLGYGADESYGVAWRLKGTSGEIVNSVLGYNFYGLYTYRVTKLVIRGNEVHHSVRYGIDPHTGSNRLTIEGNSAHHNGKHGIILAEDCTENVIRNNVVYGNAMHGIVLYQDSDDNLVDGNSSYENGLEGININDASDNTIRNNTVYGNAEAGIGVGQGARNNLVAGNEVRDNREDGIALYSKATKNTLRENVVSNNARYGIYVKSRDNSITKGNRVFENRVGVYLNIGPAPKLSREENQIYDNREADVRTAS